MGVDMEEAADGFIVRGVDEVSDGGVSGERLRFYTSTTSIRVNSYGAGHWGVAVATSVHELVCGHGARGKTV